MAFAPPRVLVVSDTGNAPVRKIVVTQAVAANPVLAHALRGTALENRHRGAFCVAHADGRVRAFAGDIDTPIFPRSAIKAIQALAMFETDVPDRFALDDKMLALACASHHGEPEHVAVADAALHALGLDEGALECGAHPPTNARARETLRARGEAPSALHNNCSGKHAGMLGVARALEIDTAGYVGRDHPVQRRVRAAVEAVLGVPMSEDLCGIDGCSIPTWATPLRALATGFARMQTGEGLSRDHALGARKLFAAITAHPHLIAGSGAFDSEAIAAFDGGLVVKIGAEGVFCGAIRATGVGFALKCDDGNMAAATAMAAELIAGLTDPDADQAAMLARYRRQVLRNWRGLEVGTIEASPAIAAALENDIA